MNGFSKDRMTKALNRLGDLLKEHKQRVELITAGGVVSVFYLGNRNTTKDIDAIFPNNARVKALLKDLVDQVAKEQNLPTGRDGWLNDDMSQFKGPRLVSSSTVIFQHSHLVLYAASWEQMLGRKLSGAYHRAGYRDESDAIEILKHIGNNDRDGVLQKVIKYKNVERGLTASADVITGRFNRIWDIAFDIKRNYLKKLEHEIEHWGYSRLEDDLGAFGVSVADDIEYEIRAELRKQLISQWDKLEPFLYERNFTQFVTGGNAPAIKSELLKVLHVIADTASKLVLSRYQSKLAIVIGKDKITVTGLITSFSRQLLLRDERSVWADA